MEIETKRLLLRPFKKEDASDLFEYLHEPLKDCFASMKLETLEDAKKEIEKRIARKDFLFAIVLKENTKVIGEIDALEETSQPDKNEKAPKDTFSPYWMLNKNYHRKGYGYEAAHAFFDYLFNEKGARRIYAYTEDTNIGSQRLCEKLGMRKEGEFKEYISFVNNEDGTPKYENTFQYAILKKEWK